MGNLSEEVMVESQRRYNSKFAREACENFVEGSFKEHIMRWVVTRWLEMVLQN